MTNKTFNNDATEKTAATKLRRRAEDRLEAKTPEVASFKRHGETTRLLHELQVHQIELEMQNEELQQARDDSEIGLEKYTDFFDFAPIGYLILDREGVVSAANLHGADMLGVERSRLIGQRLGHYVATSYRPAFTEFLNTVFLSPKKEKCELSLLNKENSPLYVQVSAMAAASGQECRLALIDITERKNTEHALFESQALLHSIINSTDDLIWSVDPVSLGLCSFNSGLVRYFLEYRGIRIENGMTLEELFPPGEFVQMWYDFYKRALDEGSYTTEYSTYSGNKILELSFKVLRKDGAVFGLSVFGKDITERKQAEHELQRSRDFLAETEKIGKVGGWEFDMDTLEQTWTEEVYRILEVDTDFKPTVDNGINFYTPSSRPILETALRRAIEHGESFDLELELITAKGNLRSVHVICNTDLDQRRGFGFFQDITEQKQAEEALKDSEDCYHRLFEMESDTVLMIDWESGRFLDANSAASSMYGYTREEFLQLTPADLSNEPSETEKSIRNEETRVALRWHRKKDGTIFPVEIADSYFVYQERKVHVAVIRDISERVQADQHLIDLNQRLHALSGHLQSVQEQERLTIARDMHDDVGQFLTALKLDLVWLEQNIASSEKAIPPRLKEMHKNIDQITAVVQRIAANLRPPLLDHQGLSAAMEWHVGEFSKHSGIECFVMINEDIGSVDKETASAIMRIIQEGLTNIARHARASEVAVSLCRREGNLILEITDNGCGITQEQIAAQNAYGLIGMQERARLCNGKLEIKGEPGCGTVLLLTIPLDLGEQSE